MRREKNNRNNIKKLPLRWIIFDGLLPIEISVQPYGVVPSYFLTDAVKSSRHTQKPRQNKVIFLEERGGILLRFPLLVELSAAS